MNPKWFDPPKTSEGLTESQYSQQLGRSIGFHTSKLFVIWSMFGVLPFWGFHIPWTIYSMFWLQLLPWMLCGWTLNLKFLPILGFHHMVSANDLAEMRIRNLFVWPYTWFQYWLVFTANGIL